MNSDSSSNPPVLAAPGAGLPKLELLIARLIFGWQRRHTSREQSFRLFAKERAAIDSLAANCDTEKGTQRVLIPRLRGLEDSSRNWSVFMTLEHLRIVNEAVAGAIESLGNGLVPAGAASTAAVKPDEIRCRSVIEGYEAACGRLTHCVSCIDNLATSARFAHPCFGPLDAAGWYFLSAIHMRLHRRQIECILRLGSG